MTWNNHFPSYGHLPYIAPPYEAAVFQPPQKNRATATSRLATHRAKLRIVGEVPPVYGNPNPRLKRPRCVEHGEHPGELVGKQAILAADKHCFELLILARPFPDPTPA